MALKGLRVIELAGLAPVPMVGMMLADAGANVVRIDKTTPAMFPDVLARGKRSVALDLKSAGGLRTLTHMCVRADVLLNPYRPGVLEGLGLAPSTLMSRNASLIVSHLHGYAPHSSMRNAAGHDINYVAMSGLLSLMRREPSDKPTPPLNLLGDFAGGSAMAVIGILMALFERSRTGRGQEVTASVTDGTAYLGSLIFNLMHMRAWKLAPFLRPGGAAYYDTYATSDGRHVAVGAIEPQFFKLLIGGLALSTEWLSKQMDPAAQPALRDSLQEAFARHPLEHWRKVFGPDGPFADACVTPVLTMGEASAWLTKSQHAAPSEGVQPPPPPVEQLAKGRFSEDYLLEPGRHTHEVLEEYGVPAHDISELVQAGHAADTAPRARL